MTDLPQLHKGRGTELRKIARQHEREGRPAEALSAAWAALDEAPGDVRALTQIGWILHFHPDACALCREADLHRVLCHDAVDPDDVARAGWHFLRTRAVDPLPDASDAARLAAWIEASRFAQDLLRQSPVADLESELRLTTLRRWLLLASRWEDFPDTTSALAVQLNRNQGTWLFDADELQALATLSNAGIAEAYPGQGKAALEPAPAAGSVTRAVAAQYENWPYPQWTRITAPEPTTLPAFMSAIDPGGAPELPVDAKVLIAGCGTGREAAIWARKFPDTHITGIDLSCESLSYAQARLAALGIGNVALAQLDLHAAATLGRQFDFILCSGVLHHLPDPELGWEALCDVLAPGGVMRVMVYSRKARLPVRAARALVEDLTAGPIDGDVLRAVRRRLMTAPLRPLVARSPDFYTLSGVHDLILHRHEDPFNVARIRRAMDTLGLKLLRFNLHGAAAQARYLKEHPGDPLFRDFDAWTELERSQRFEFSRMHDLVCRKLR